jgi:MFS family permease
MGAIGLVLILRTREMTGSYAAGGAVAAAHMLGLAIGSPLLGRIIDRRGQPLVIALAGVWSAAALTAFAALPSDTTVWVAVALGAASGAAIPPMSACIRAIWSDRLEPRLRHSAYALDSVVFEIVYISGPLLVVGLLGAWSLRAAALACALFTLGGSLWFAATRLSREWRPHPRRSTDAWGPLRGAGVQTILAAFLLFALAIAGIEIAVAAFAEREGSANAVGWLFGLWGAGSMAGGLYFGRLAAPADPGRRLAWLLLALALLEAPLAFVDSLAAMAVALTLAGLAIAPAMALSFALLSDVAPAGTVTEAQTWVATALGGGMAAGSALCGWLVEHTGTSAALALVTGFSLLAALVVAARQRTLVVAREPEREREPAYA